MDTMAVDSKYYMHDLDRNALKALRAIPGFHQLTRAFMKVWQERQARIVNMSSNVRITERQLGEYYEMLPPICERLGIEVPDLYLELDVNANAYTYGDTHPYIVITSGLLETVPHELVPTVLAHECGHIACHHTLYRTMGGIVFGTATSALAQAVGTVPFGGLVSLPLEIAFSYWMRCSEYSADRAAVVCDGTAERMSEVCMRFAGFDKDIEAEASKEEFLAQAVEYREMVSDSKWDKTLEFLMFSGIDHPLTAVRALECEEWAAGDRFRSIMDGSFLSEEVEEEPSAEEADEQVTDDANGEEEPKRPLFTLPKAPKIPFGPWAKAGDLEEASDEEGLEAAASASQQSVPEQIREFKALLDDGIITQEEFDAKKQQLLGL